MTHLHIGYGDSATGCLLEAIDTENLCGDGAIPSRDDFTQGPISKCLGPEGIQQRIDYWASIEKVLGNGRDVESIYLESIQILEEMQADQVTLWVGDSCHDILATGWLLSFLKDRSIEWHLINLATVDRVDFPTDSPAVNLAMYRPNQISDLWKYRKKLSQIDLGYYLNTFIRVSKENSVYRIKNGLSIHSVKADYYDDYILSFVNESFKSVFQIMGEIMRDGKHQISDTTILWNIRKLIDTKVLDHRGTINNIEEYVVRFLP